MHSRKVKKMSSIVLELQRDALDRQVPISDLLRKAYVVAKKLRIAEFQNWVSQELNGYERAEDIPKYRQVNGSIKAWNPFHGWQAVIFHDPEREEILSRRACGQSIAEIESLLAGKERSDSLMMPFTAAQEQILRKAIHFDTQITLMISSTAMVRIVDAVRTTILNWAMKLEEDGIIGEGLSFTPNERQIADRSSYNINNFFGSVQGAQIQQGTSGSFQVSFAKQFDQTALNEFFSLLRKEMPSLGLSSEIEQELDAEIKTAEAQARSPKPKNNVIRESLSSIRRIIEGAGAGIGAQLLLQLASLLS
jgi:hypothetical protein